MAGAEDGPFSSVSEWLHKRAADAERAMQAVEDQDSPEHSAAANRVHLHRELLALIQAAPVELEPSQDHDTSEVAHDQAR